MKKIKLTQGYKCLVNDEDFKWLNVFKWAATVVRNKAGEVKYVYATRTYYEKDGTHTTVQMHRWILGVEDSKTRVDHKDRDGLNNQRENLRVATVSQNLQNQELRPNNTSGFKGVVRSATGKRWYSQIGVDGRKLSLGTFDFPEEAAQAYDKAAYLLFGKFALTNHELGLI